MNRILVFRIGSLGDTLVALPALWALREHDRTAHVTLLCDQQVGKQYVLAPEILGDCPVVDDFLTYPVGGSSFARVMGMLRLLAAMRWRRYHLLVYLAPTYRSPAQMARDWRFFRLGGIRKFIGLDFLAPTPSRNMPSASPLPPAPHEADALLQRIAGDGITVPPPGTGKMDLCLGEREEREVCAWLSRLPSDGDRKWVGVGLGGKQPVNLWPYDRYQAVVARLINDFDVWPVIFCGPDEKQAADELVEAWGRGYNAAGALSVRATVQAMKRCALYVGNDTGTTHMAAAAGIACVGVYSSRERPGMWYPYGLGHTVLRTPIECEGCMLSACVDRGMKCLLSIDVQSVYRACSQRLADLQDRSPDPAIFHNLR